MRCGVDGFAMVVVMRYLGDDGIQRHGFFSDERVALEGVRVVLLVDETVEKNLVSVGKQADIASFQWKRRDQGDTRLVVRVKRAHAVAFNKQGKRMAGRDVFINDLSQVTRGDAT